MRFLSLEGDAGISASRQNEADFTPHASVARRREPILRPEYAYYGRAHRYWGKAAGDDGTHTYGISGPENNHCRACEGYAIVGRRRS